MPLTRSERQVCLKAAARCTDTGRLLFLCTCDKCLNDELLRKEIARVEAATRDEERRRQHALVTRQKAEAEVKAKMEQSERYWKVKQAERDDEMRRVTRAAGSVSDRKRRFEVPQPVDAAVHVKRQERSHWCKSSARRATPAPLCGPGAVNEFIPCTFSTFSSLETRTRNLRPPVLWVRGV